MDMPENTLISRKLLMSLREVMSNDAADVFMRLYNESDPERTVEEILEIVRICGWEDHVGIIREYFSIAESEKHTQDYFHDGDQPLSEIFTEMVRQQYRWIGMLYLLDYDVSGYVSDLIDALEENSDRREFRGAVKSIARVLCREMDEGESGRWFTQDGFV